MVASVAGSWVGATASASSVCHAAAATNGLKKWILVWKTSSPHHQSIRS